MIATLELGDFIADWAELDTSKKSISKSKVFGAIVLTSLLVVGALYCAGYSQNTTKSSSNVELIWKFLAKVGKQITTMTQPPECAPDLKVEQFSLERNEIPDTPKDWCEVTWSDIDDNWELAKGVIDKPEFDNAVVQVGSGTVRGKNGGFKRTKKEEGTWEKRYLVQKESIDPSCKDGVSTGVFVVLRNDVPWGRTDWCNATWEEATKDEKSLSEVRAQIIAKTTKWQVTRVGTGSITNLGDEFKEQEHDNRYHDYYLVVQRSLYTN